MMTAFWLFVTSSEQRNHFDHLGKAVKEPPLGDMPVSQRVFHCVTRLRANKGICIVLSLEGVYSTVTKGGGAFRS